LTPHLNVKVTVFLNIKYLENGTTVATMANIQEVVYDLLNGDIFSDLE